MTYRYAGTEGKGKGQKVTQRDGVACCTDWHLNPSHTIHLECLKKDAEFLYIDADESQEITVVNK